MLGFVLTPGQTSDYEAVPALFALDVPKPRRTLAGKGYEGDQVHQDLLIHGILPVIPSKSNRREPIPRNAARYTDRNRIERMFNRLKQFRRIATRYDKTALSFLTSIRLMLRRLCNPS